MLTIPYTPDFFSSLPFPKRPLCTDNFHLDGVYRLPIKEAMEHAYIQPNAKNLMWVVVFDIDREYAVLAWENAGLPPPTWTTQNPVNGHAHIAYALNHPVSRSELSKLKPLRLLARIEHAMSSALSADRSYTGLITKTPGHFKWRTEVWRDEPYGLYELLEHLPDNLALPKKIKRSTALGIGRNVSMFDGLRLWAYRNRLKHDNFDKWLKSCEQYASGINNEFISPLPYSEVKATAKSVAKWTWSNFSSDKFSAIQEVRGKRSGIARKSLQIDLLQQAVQLNIFAVRR